MTACHACYCVCGMHCHAPQREFRMKFSKSWSINLRLRMQRCRSRYPIPTTAQRAPQRLRPRRATPNRATIWHHPWGHHTVTQNKTDPQKEYPGSPPAVQISTGWPGGPPPPRIGVLKIGRDYYPSSHAKGQRNLARLHLTIRAMVSASWAFFIIIQSRTMPSRIMVDHRIWQYILRSSANWQGEIIS